jgi:hypothetical protein
VSPHLALSLDIAAGVVIAGAVFGAIWLGLSLAADSRATGTGLLLILAGAAPAAVQASSLWRLTASWSMPGL